MSDASPPPDVRLRLPAPLRRARGVAMTAGLAMTPLMILAGVWADRAAPIGPHLPPGIASATLRPTIAPDASQR